MSKSKNEVATDVITSDRRNFIRGAGAVLGAGALASFTPAANAVSAPSASRSAFVTSSDEGGNFYKSISMMSLDGLKGFSMNM